VAQSKYERGKAWRARRKVRLVYAFGSRCGQCGLVDDPVVYDFHHLDPAEKDFQLTSGKMVAWETLVAEAKKCAMICSHCHRKYHSGVLSLKADMPTFDESLIPKELTHGVVVHKSTAVARQAHSKRIPWEVIDLVKLMGEHDHKIDRVARQLGVSWKAVRNRLKNIDR